VSILLDIVIPVFGLVGIGYAAALLRVFDAERLKGLSYFAFGFAIPALLLRSMARMELEGQVAWPFLLSYYIGTFTVFAIGLAVARIAFGRTIREAAIAGMASSYSNTVLLGIPLLLTVFGERASLPVFLLIAFHSLLIFPTVTTVLEVGRGTSERLRHIPLSTLRGLVRNPILVGLAVGLLVNMAGVALPATVDSLLQTLGRAAVPCALFAMGASLYGYRIAGEKAQIGAFVGLKLIAHPFAVWLLASQVFALDPLWMNVAVVMAALPAGVNVYVMAENYGAAAQAAAGTVLLGTAAAVASISALLFVLGSH
jgi:predicted permease